MLFLVIQHLYCTKEFEKELEQQMLVSTKQIFMNVFGDLGQDVLGWTERRHDFLNLLDPVNK